MKHLKNQDFEPLIQKALECDGFDETAPETHTMTGFGHGAVLGIAGDVIKAIEAGQIRKFLLIGGCDGSESERSYYRNLAMKLPQSSVILTLGCAKFRFNKMFDKFGAVPGTNIPCMLYIGQFNDSYSAIQIALALANVRCHSLSFDSALRNLVYSSAFLSFTVFDCLSALYCTRTALPCLD